MPFTFLLFSGVIILAIISPFVGVGIIGAMCVQRWRPAARLAGKIGAILAIFSALGYTSLIVLLGKGTAIEPLAVATLGGAGFTAGVMGTSAWIFTKFSKV